MYKKLRSNNNPNTGKPYVSIGRNGPIATIGLEIMSSNEEQACMISPITNRGASSTCIEVSGDCMTEAALAWLESKGVDINAIRFTKNGRADSVEEVKQKIAKLREEKNTRKS